MRLLTARLLVLACLSAGAMPARPAETVFAARFSSLVPGSALPSEFKELVPDPSRPRTRYSLVDDAGRTVLRAESVKSASALARDQRIDPGRYPILTWQWKITRLLDRSDIGQRAGDDFPVRLYVFFDYDVARLPFGERMKLRVARALYGAAMPLAALCYVWDTKSAAGTVANNAYTDRVRMIVVESGAAKRGQWVAVERDVARDFRTAFGEDPPQITGIAVAVDTDDTGESALSLFGDILFRSRPVTQ